MTVNLSPLGGAAQQFFDNNGVILSGGKIYTYTAGTTTPATTYTSSTGGTAHANPIVLDSAGRVPGGEIWLDNAVSYKFVLSTSVDVILGTYDNLSGSAAAIDFYGPNGASNVGKLGGGTVQDFIDQPTPDSMIVGNCTEISAAVPGDPLSAILFRAVSAGRRGEIQVSPNDGVGGATKDAFAGGETTIYGYDLQGPLGAANNIAATFRAARNAGTVVSFDIATFAPGSTADVPTRFLNEAKGYTVEISASTGKLNALQGIRAGDAIGGFSPSNNVPLFAAAGDQPAYDWEERTANGVTLLYNWRARLVGGNWSLYNITAGTVPFQITGAGRVLAPYVDTKIITGGNYTPNLWMDSADGQIYRTGWSKVTANANATDLASAISLVNQIKATLIAYGIMQ